MFPIDLVQAILLILRIFCNFLDKYKENVLECQAIRNEMCSSCDAEMKNCAKKHISIDIYSLWTQRR